MSKATVESIWMTAQEAAARLGLSVSTVRRLALEGAIYRRDRGRKRYDRTHVEKLAVSQQPAQSA